jgi:hypothetical protein
MFGLNFFSTILIYTYYLNDTIYNELKYEIIYVKVQDLLVERADESSLRKIFNKVKLLLLYPSYLINFKILSYF